MLLFAAHDIGALNQIRPLFQRALREGYDARWVRLGEVEAVKGEDGAYSIVESGDLELLVVGCSGNSHEWALIEACRHLGIGVAMYVEIGLGSRFEGVDISSSPDIFLVSNAHCGVDLVELGVEGDRVRLVGSCHLESLAKRVDFCEETSLRSQLNVDSSSRIVSFFTNPNSDSVAVLERLLEMLDDAPGQSELVVRPHPRMQVNDQSRLEEVCRRWSCAHCDRDSNVDTPSLLYHSAVSFTMGSTVSAESLAIGTPSAFFQIGWNYEVFEALYSNLEIIPRIRDRGDFLTFLELDQLNNSSLILESGFEGWDGSLDRGWKEVETLMKACRR